MAYQQLTQEQRYQIFTYREAGLSLREIRRYESAEDLKQTLKRYG